jgi:hypothetical protein
MLATVSVCGEDQGYHAIMNAVGRALRIQDDRTTDRAPEHTNIPIKEAHGIRVGGPRWLSTGRRTIAAGRQTVACS